MVEEGTRGKVNSEKFDLVFSVLLVSWVNRSAVHIRGLEIETFSFGIGHVRTDSDTSKKIAQIS